MHRTHYVGQVIKYTQTQHQVERVQAESLDVIDRTLYEVEWLAVEGLHYGKAIEIPSCVVVRRNIRTTKR